MKNYFIKKLTVVSDSTKRIENEILKAAAEMNVKSLLILPSRLEELRSERSRWINDVCTFCSVDDVIEISEIKDWHKNPLMLIRERDIENFYKYNNIGISIQDRDKLVAKFGYQLKDAKIK